MTVISAAAAASALLLGACGGSNSADQPSGHQSGDASGHGTAGSACDEATVADTLGHIVGEAQMVVASMDRLDCSGDWASAVATVAGREEGSAQSSEVFLLQRDGDIWVLKARETACGTFMPGDPMPADAQVPADLWEVACLTG